MNLISVIIPAYQHTPMVLRALASLQAKQMSEPVEYIVSDDCSPEPMQPFIPASAARYIRTPENLGFAGNCNFAAKHAQGDILFFVNQDTYTVDGLSDGWNAQLRMAFDDSQVGVVGARLLTPDGRIQSAGGAFDAACQPFHPYLGWSYLDHRLINHLEERSWVTGAALAVRRWVFEQVGGFGSEYGKAYFEDVDICLKVRQMGLRVMYDPSVTLVHTVGSCGGSPNFMKSATAFKKKWVDTKLIEPEVPYLAERYWV